MALQRKGLTLLDSRFISDELTSSVETGKEVILSPMYQSTLASNYIYMSASIMHSMYLESGLIKILSGNISEMSQNDREATNKLILY